MTGRVAGKIHHQIFVIKCRWSVALFEKPLHRLDNLNVKFASKLKTDP